MNQAPKSACVLGAGIIGLATAWRLSREGYDVTVIDRALPGCGASGGNGSQLSYSYVQPLADPSIWAQLPRLLLKADSPLKLRPQLDWRQWAWGLQFLAACRASVSRRTTVQLLALASTSRAQFDRMLREEKLDCDFSATGKLVLYSSEESFAGARRQLELQRALGSEQSAITPARCVEIEPALAHYAPQIAGAIFTPSECAADCYKVCLSLERVLRARGVRFMLGADISEIVEANRRVVAVATSQGMVEADAYVMCLGTASAPLARKLSLYLPVYPLKGYSITVQAREAGHAAPLVNVTDSKRKVVFARIGSRLRVAGMAELVGDNTSIPSRRIAALEEATRTIFPGCSDFADLNPWTGMRPATPTGLPIIGRLGHAPSNLLFNTGHGALGFTLAFGSAQRIAGLMAHDERMAAANSAPGLLGAA